VREVALPHDQRREAHLPQLSYDARIAFFVRHEFRDPEFAVPAGRSREPASLVMMPEATMHEDGPTARTICEVRRTWKIAVLESKPNPDRVKRTSQG
jgi:hypothetical protein